MMGVLLANIAMWTGRPTVAIERSQEARRLFQEIGDRWGEVQSIAPAARALGCLGRVDEAEALHAEVATFTDALGDPGLVAIPASVAGALAGHLGDGERSAREFQADLERRQVTREVRCPKCQAANKVREPYCLRCAEPLTDPAPPCQNCGKVCALGSRFCIHCGGPLR